MLLPAVVRTTIFTLGVLKDHHHLTETFANANYEHISTTRAHTQARAHTHTHSVYGICL